MRPFAYEAPVAVDEAVDALGRHGERAKVLAGGQSLIPLLTYRLARPEVVVDINGLPLDYQRREAGSLRLGALTRHATLIDSHDVARACPLLSEAAALVGNVRVRTLGTLGGSLAHADPAAELPMAMVALDASITARGPSGSRAIAARELFTGYLTTALRPDEIVTEIEVPVFEAAGVAVEELSRRGGDFAIVAVAAVVTIDRRGRVDDARIALGGVGPAPVRARAAEDLLRGQEPTAEGLAAAGARVPDEITPESDAFVSAAYRRLLAPVLTRRALLRAVGRAMDWR